MVCNPLMSAYRKKMTFLQVARSVQLVLSLLLFSADIAPIICTVLLIRVVILAVNLQSWYTVEALATCWQSQCSRRPIISFYYLAHYRNYYGFCNITSIICMLP